MEEFASAKERRVAIKRMSPPAFSLSKNDLNKRVILNYTNCFNAISKAVALMFFLSELKPCAFSIAFLMISDVS